MIDDPFDPGDGILDERIVQRRTRRTSEAVNRLCGSWIGAWGDMLVGSIRVAGDVAEGLRDSYCDPEGKRRRRD